MLNHKGYLAAVEFDETVNRLHGEVVNSGDYPIATFEATDVSALQREFQISVDAYLASCEEDGVDPVRPVALSADLAKSPVLVVRVPEVRFGLDLFQRMGDAARMSGLSLGRWLERTVKNALS